MAGDTVTMSIGSVMMIHDPAGITFGNSASHSKTIEQLEALATAYALTYARKSGKSADACRAIMRDERWLSPEQAVAEGFADAVAQSGTAPVAAFDYRAYAHAPERLVAMAATQSWDRPVAPKAETRKEFVMPDENKDARASAAARIKAIMKAPEAEGRAEMAEHLAFETEMEAEQAIALMKVSPAAAAEQGNGFYRESGAGRVVTRAGLPDSPRSKTSSSIVSAMKRRHGKTEG